MRARLLIENDVLGHRTIALDRSPFAIGRASGSQLQLDHRSVSRRHACLTERKGVWWIEDLGSANGCQLEGHPLSEPTPLSTGASLRIGELPLRFELVAETVPSGASARAPRRPKGLALAFLVFGVLAVALSAWILTGGPRPAESGSEDSQSSSEKPSAAPRIPDPATAGAGSSVGPLGSAGEAESPNGTKPTEAAEVTAPPAPPREPSDPEDAATKGPEKTRVDLQGRRAPLHGRVIDDLKLHPLHLLLFLEGRGEAIRIPRERVLKLDGKPFRWNAAALLSAKITAATALEDRVATLEFAQAHGLLLAAPAQELAAQILSEEPNHPLAREATGQRRIAGSWASASELRAAGRLGPEGRVLGNAADLKARNHLSEALRGRPLLASELEPSVAASLASNADRWLGSSEHWNFELAEVSRALFPRWARPALAPSLTRASKRLSQGNISFERAILELAANGALAVAWPRPKDGVIVLIRGLLGPGAAADEDRVAEALRMLRGEEGVIFGSRGSSADDFLAILAKQPEFRGRQLDRIARRLRPEALDRRARLRATLAVNADENAWLELMRTWVAESNAAQRWSQDFPASPDLIAARILSCLRAEPPRAEEVAVLAPLIGGGRSGREVAIQTVAPKGPFVDPFPKRRTPPEPGPQAHGSAWIHRHARASLARPPSSSELLALSEAIAEGLHPTRALAALLLAEGR